MIAGRSFRRDDGGAVILELMIVVPLLLMFGVYMVEISNFFLRQQQVITALRAAGDYVESCEMSTPKCTQASKNARVTDIVRRGVLGNTTGIPANQMAINTVSLTVSPSTDPPPRLAVLQVNYTYTGGSIFAATVGMVSAINGSRTLTRRVLP